MGDDRSHSDLRAHWAMHRKRLSALLDLLHDRLPERDLLEVGTFIVRNEFGVAFEFLIGSVLEHGATLGCAEVDFLDALGETLDEHGRWEDARPTAFPPGR